VIRHADRVEPLRDYCLGLLLPGDRKSVEPIAAVTAPARVSAKHQSLLHFVANAPWSDDRVLSRVQELTLPILEGSGAIEAWIMGPPRDWGCGSKRVLSGSLIGEAETAWPGS
jgi:SRSO17 transposase